MTDVVTRLVVRGDGSLAVLDQFENKMEAAGKATDRATGAVTNYEARMAKARAAMEAGNAISTQTVARRSAEQRAFDGLASSVDKSYGLRIRLEREAERAAVSAANAVNMGYITNEQALSTLVALERRHAAQMSQSAAANDNLAHSYRASAVAADEAAAASMRANAARMRGGGGVNQAHTTNLLFQAQDIAMMTAMGQAPMMLAMQQGMQVGGIFHQIGSGRQIVQALGGAIVGLLNPLNLATIAAIGFGAAGVQWFMSAMNSADDATTALERHNEWLDKTLEGYKAVRDAAGDALAAALKLPEASVASDLSAQQAVAAERSVAALEKVLALQSEFQGYANYAEAFGVPDDVAASLAEVSGLISQVSADATLSSQELDLLHTAFTHLANSTADQNIKNIANEALALVDAARQGNAEVRSLNASLDALPRDVQIRLRVAQEFASASEGLESLYMDPRSRFDVSREQAKNFAEQQMATAQTYGQLTGAASQYERVLSSINAAEAEANEKANAKGAKAAAKPFDQWSGNVDQFQQRIASQRLEIELIGQSTYEVERQKSAFDLLNQAKQAGIPITSKVTEQINLMSAEYAASTVQLQLMQEQQNNALMTTTALTSTMGSLFKDILKGTKSAGDAFADLASRIGDMFIDNAFSMLGSMFKPGAGMGGGGSRGGLFGGSIIPGILHSGGTAGADGYNHGRQFSPAIWANAPRYHNGGVAGLRPNEVPAILERGEKVIPANQNAPAGGQSVVVIRLEDGLKADIVSQAVGQSVQISRGMVEPVSKAVDQMAQQQRYG
ncbi:phage tail length tape measure family protein [Devosia sp. A369]